MGFFHLECFATTDPIKSFLQHADHELAGRRSKMKPVDFIGRLYVPENMILLKLDLDLLIRKPVEQACQSLAAIS